MRKEHRRIAVVLVFSMMISLLSFARTCEGAVSEEDAVFTSGDWSYELLKDGNAQITRYSGNDENLCIPEEIDGYKVTSIGDRAIQNNQKLKTVEFPDTVEYIGYSAFARCKNLDNLVLPKGLTCIDSWAFGECSFTGDLEIPEGVTVIATYAFGSSGFTGKLTLHQNVTEIGMYAFAGCKFTGELVLPKNLMHIGNGAFGGCNFTGTLTIPQSVTEIQSFAFDGNTGISKIVIPREVTEIKSFAFRDVPATIYGYSGSTAQTYATTHGMPFVDLDTGVMTTPTPTEEPTPTPTPTPTEEPTPTPTPTLPVDTELTSGDWSYKLMEGGYAKITGYIGSDENLCIPGEVDGHKVISIGDNAFLERKLTGSLEIPEGVEEIGGYAFFGNRFTGDLILPSSVNQIGIYAFRFCQYLKGKLILPEGITKIEEGAFEDCGFTGTLTIPQSVTEIEEAAFDSTSGITKIVIPRETTWIAETAFRNVPATIYGYSGSAAEAYANTYGMPFVDLEATPTPTPTLPVDTELISGDWLYKLMEGGYAKITGYIGSDANLCIPGEVDGHKVISIGDYAFFERKLTGNLEIPEGVEEIGGYAFSGNRFTGDLILPSSIKQIGQEAFRFCRYLKGKLILPEGITKIEEGAFQECGFTGTLTIPKSMTEIEETVFHATSGITKIVIPRETTWISETAFGNVPATIYGYSGSAAEAYANTYGMPFVDLEATPIPSVTPTSPAITPTTTPTVPPISSSPVAESPLPTPAIPSVPPSTGNSDDVNTGTNWQSPVMPGGQLQITGVQGVPDDFPKIKWNQNPHATGYEIYRSGKKNTGYQKIQSITAKQTEFIDRKAKRGKSYYYKIRAIYDKVVPAVTGEFSQALRLKRQYLNTPVLKLKRVKKSGRIIYLKLTVRKSEGKQIQIYFQKGKKKKIVRLRSKKIKRVYRLQYKSSAKHMTFQIRTYVKKGKRIRYSRFAVIKI